MNLMSGIDFLDEIPESTYVPTRKARPVLAPLHVGPDHKFPAFPDFCRLMEIDAFPVSPPRSLANGLRYLLRDPASKKTSRPDREKRTARAADAVLRKSFRSPEFIIKLEADLDRDPIDLPPPLPDARSVVPKSGSLTEMNDSKI
jgi:hypothetical protein